jgi:hypothetical protein
MSSGENPREVAVSHQQGMVEYCSDLVKRGLALAKMVDTPKGAMFRGNLQRNGVYRTIIRRGRDPLSEIVTTCL